MHRAVCGWLFTQPTRAHPHTQGSFLYAPHHEELKAILLINHLQQTARNNLTPSATGMQRPTAAELAAVDPHSSTGSMSGPHRGVLMRTYLAIFGPMVDNQVLKSISNKELEPIEQCEKCRVRFRITHNWFAWHLARIEQAPLLSARGGQCGHVLCNTCYKAATEGMAKLRSSVPCPICQAPGALTHSIQLKGIEQLVALRCV